MNRMVYIIILNWNGWQDSTECIESCRKLSYSNFRILIVDNGSTDGSESILRERFPELEIIQTGANLGFAGGNNVGIRYALEHGADYVWLLNNDTIADPDALTQLVNVAGSDGRIGIVGSKIFYHTKQDKLWFAGGIWRSTKSYATHRGLNEDDSGQYDEICGVDFITGCSLLVKAAVIEDIGFMNEDYFLYWEDVDWNALAAKHGWRLLYVPSSIVFHKISASIGNTSYLANRYYTRNCLLFFQRHEVRRLPMLVLYIINDAIKLWRGGQLDTARGSLHGLKDFLLRRFGQIK